MVGEVCLWGKMFQFQGTGGPGKWGDRSYELGNREARIRGQKLLYKERMSASLCTYIRDSRLREGNYVDL